MKIPDRPTVEQNAIELAYKVSERSEDRYKKVGAVALNKENRIVSTGYNGLPSKFELPQCVWEDRDERRKYIIHAEENAITGVPRHSIETLFCTMIPCIPCLVRLRNHGVKKVIYAEAYSSPTYGTIQETHAMAGTLKIDLEKFDNKENVI